MPATNSQKLPEIFRPEDSKWASRATKRGEIRRLAQGLYTSNLQEPAERLLQRHWYDVAALYFPEAVIADRSAVLAGPADDGSLFLDIGSRPGNPRPVALPGLTLRPRNGPGPVQGDTGFVDLHISSPARTALDNLRPSRARSGVARTLRRAELEAYLERLARVRGAQALNELRDDARSIAPALDAEKQLADLDDLVGALLGTRKANLRTPAAKARHAGLAYDTERLHRFEVLRAELAKQDFAERPEPADPERLFAFFEAYFSNWIEGTEFEVDEAEEILFDGRVPSQRPADAHDIQGTFEAINDPALRAQPPGDADILEEYLREVHRRIMGGRPETGPGDYKDTANRAGMTLFVHPELVKGTLREGFTAYQTLAAGVPRAIYAMFLVAEVHPFADGNGRVARALMNAELSAAGLCRVMVPMSYRDEYMSALRALSQNENPTPLWRMIDRAQRWASRMPWTGHDRVLRLMRETNALVAPDNARELNLHLLDPGGSLEGAAMTAVEEDQLFSTDGPLER
jgi:fido (protein-threonine AMPylation protein)